MRATLWKDYGRYRAQTKFITDPAALAITPAGEVALSPPEAHDIVADLSGCRRDFDALRPTLARIATDIGTLDDTAQRFSRLCLGTGWRFPYDLAVLRIRGEEVILRYWGREENTEFDVIFRREGEGYRLIAFGTRREIPQDWDQETDIL